MSEKIAASKRLDGELATARMIERGARPLVPYPEAAVPWHCICLACGADIWPRYDSVVNAGQGVCDAACKLRKIGEARRLDGLDSADLMKDNDLLPLADYPGAGEPWMCRCLRCAEVGFPTYSNVRARGHQCWSCRARKIGSRLRLSESEAVARMRENGFEPLTAYPGSVALPWHSRCVVCETVITPGPTLNLVRETGGGCHNCADYGINPDKPGYLYLITVKTHRALKWGIANSEGRLAQHAKTGWRLDSRWDFPAARAAQEIERTVKSWVRRQGFKPAMRADQMPYGGYTETASIDDLSIDDLRQYVERLVIWGPNTALCDGGAVG